MSACFPRVVTEIVTLLCKISGKIKVFETNLKVTAGSCQRVREVAGCPAGHHTLCVNFGSNSTSIIQYKLKRIMAISKKAFL